MTHHTTAAPRQRRSMFGRRRHNHAHAHVSVGTTHHNNGPVPRRRTSIGDKVSGALMKLRGSLTRRPGLKAAGTRRMHGTDGRGSHRVY